MRPEAGRVLEDVQIESSEPRQGAVDRFERRQRIANQWCVLLDVVQAITNSEGGGVAALMIDPVGNFLARGGKSRLPGVEQGEQGGDGLFFGHGKHLRSRNLLLAAKSPQGSELFADGVADPSAVFQYRPAQGR